MEKHLHIETLSSMIRRGLREENLDLLSLAVDSLRFRHGLNYEEIYELARTATGLSVSDWDAVLYQVDMGQEPTLDY